MFKKKRVRFEFFLSAHAHSVLILYKRYFHGYNKIGVIHLCGSPIHTFSATFIGVCQVKISNKQNW